MSRLACLWSKMPIFQRAETREGGLLLQSAFQYLICMKWGACALNLVKISSLASKYQDFKLKRVSIPFHTTTKKLAIELESEDIMTEFKSQTLHVIRIKYWKVGGSGNRYLFLIPALLNIGILLQQQAILGKHFEPQCMPL